MLDLFRQAFAWSSVSEDEAFVFDASLDVKVRHLLPAPSQGGLHEESRLEHEESLLRDRLTSCITLPVNLLDTLTAYTNHPKTVSCLSL